ncbi:MAG: hypothetical protein ACK5O9_01285 [Holosporales bacterium]|jgi:hypothetical protein
MLSLKIPTEPYWIDLKLGVRVQVRPFTSAVFYAAQAVARQKLGSAPVDDAALEEGRRIAAFTTALAKVGILAWDGVLLPDSDEQAPVNDQTVGDLMSFWTLADEFRTQYTGLKELLDAEKKPCLSDANGTSAAEPTTAPDAVNSDSLVPVT